jgi:acetyl-CoA acetyltransferase family protein
MLDIAIVEGVRTPFVKAFGPLAGVPAPKLGEFVTRAVLQRAGLQPDVVDQVVFGNIATPADSANIARVIALRAGIPQDRPAVTVQRNCASGMEAITTGAMLIALGEARTVLAGGTESMSQIPFLYNKSATEQYMRVASARTFWKKTGAFLGFRPRHFKPVIALKEGLTDPVSGLIMGETAEVLVDDFGITRQQQDEYALLSHQRAVAATERGTLAEEIVPLSADFAGTEIKDDVGPRKGQSMEALGKLKPYFRANGTVTVGNSCQITDGAAAAILMPGEAVRAEGRKPLGYVRAFAYAGCDPRRMGLGPAFATAKLLAKTGLSLRDIELVELNEAFAAVVLANEKAFASEKFAKEQLNRSEPLGELNRSTLNVNGGAIALGHPVGVTGTRLVLTTLKELHRRGGRYGLATLCVGGGQGGAVLVERG